MITLRHKVTGKEQIFIPSYFNKNKVDFSKYEILTWDVVELVWGNGEEISEGWYDIERAKEKIDKSSPTMNYRLKDVPRPDLLVKGNLLPTNTAKAYTKTINRPIKMPSLSILKNDYIKYTIIAVIGGVAVLIIWFFLYPYMKHNFPNYDLP